MKREAGGAYLDGGSGNSLGGTLDLEVGNVVGGLSVCHDVLRRNCELADTAATDGGWGATDAARLGIRVVPQLLQLVLGTPFI